MAGDLCLIAFYLECLLICVSAYCWSSDQSEKCVHPKKSICVPDECGNPMFVCEYQFAVESGKCPYYNKQLQRMDVTECSAEQVCPNDSYLASDLVQKSKDCLANPKKTNRCFDQTSKSTTEMNTELQSKKQHQTNSIENLGGSGAGAAVGVVVALLILVVVMVMLVVFYRRNVCGVRKTMEPWVDNIRNNFQGNRESEAMPSCRNDIRNNFQGNRESEAMPSCRNDEETGLRYETEIPLLQEDKPMYARVNKDNSKKKDTIKDVTAVDSNEWNGACTEEMKMKIRKLNILQKYLVHILRREIEAKELKEKSIIHSRALGEHFTEPVLHDLYRVENSDDYSKLDMSVVYTLLRNFCVNFKPPTRGWDYEPPAEEQTVGADIERIRIMWNKYCDNNYDFRNLDDVFNRMKNKYGTEAVQNDQELLNRTQDEMEDILEMKEKIDSFKLNPDCYVEKGIVITGGIKSALQILETWNVVICKGAIGCGKTHALKTIESRYKEKGWKVRWMEENLLSLEENIEDKALVICDNLFGSYGCNTFSSNKLSSFENVLESMREKSRNIQVAVGIHQHIFDEVKRNHNLKLLQNKNMTVDLDKLTKSELLLIFKEQQKEGHCKTDPNCLFKTVDTTSVLDKLRENQGHIGSLFLSLMYCHLHELFLDKDFIKNPLQSLIQRFQKMRNDSSDYYSLIYLMCVRKYKNGDELSTWAGTVDALLSKDTLQNAASKMPAFIRVENGVETLRHEVLTIALFKAASYVEEVFLPVVKKCEIDILFQLMRPEESCNTEFSCAFVNPKKKTIAKTIGIHLVKRFADKFKSNWYSIEHPLKSTELFRNKFDSIANPPNTRKEI